MTPSTDHGAAQLPSGRDSMRLGPRPGEVIDRTTPITFRWNGEPAAGYPGDTIASALAASGVRVFSRSFKYHRPRGLLTAGFHEPGCMLQVGHEPNVRGAHRLLEPGMDVCAQNAWPSLRYDVKAVNQLVARFLTPGFYYKTFMAPRPLWPAYQRVLRRFSVGGTVPTAPPAVTYDHRHVHVDVLVAGGGPSGMAAALAAAESGARVMLVDEEHALGGHLRWGDAAQQRVAADLAASLARTDVEILTDAVVTGRYDGNWVSVMQRSLGHVTERLIKARVGTLVVAPGLIERPYVFAGNDLPGAMLSSAVRRLINLYAVRPGLAAVVLTANADGDAAVADLRGAGVEVRAVIDARGGGDILRAHGRGSVQAVECVDGRTIECDLLVTAIGWTAPTALLNMAGDMPVWNAAAARFVPGGSSEDVIATGGIVGDGSVDELIAHGRAIGQHAAQRGRGKPAAGTTRNDLHPDLQPALFRSETHGFVDFSEDVSSKDIEQAVAEGYDHVELAKRYTTATMGPVQGKLEVVNTVAAVARANGTDIAATGTTVWRPPYAPVSLGALAGRIHEPVRRSPMHDWHAANGAVPLVAGAWIRPDHYGDPMREASHVRERVGIIDVTPLGTLDLQGPDVPRLLELLYVNKWSRLPVGSVRYGAMCAEDGVVLDDGVTGRLGADHYVMTTTSSGALTVWEWIENWLQTERPDWRVHVTPVTTAYASINVAGPQSRELLARLVDDVDLGPEGFPYMRVRSARVAGVADCFMWRIGFTGELSFEVHVPSGYGLHVWTALLAAGADLDVRPFGVEAQRILRLEKGHPIVGQDTDGLTQAFGAGLGWAVKLDKADFAGRPELDWQHERGPDPQLVALQPVDPSIVPPEASQIVEGEATIVGRITSSRMSPTLRRSICLGYVTASRALAGTDVMVVQPDGSRVAARVMPQLAHVDPDGARLRAAPPWQNTSPGVTTVPGPAARSPVGIDAGTVDGSGATDRRAAAGDVAATDGARAVAHGWLVAVDHVGADVLLSDQTALRKIWVRAPRHGRVADVLPALGLARRVEGDALACGFGPGEWMIIAPLGSEVAIASALHEAAGDDDALLTSVDVTHGRILLRLTGTRSSDVLAKICAIDLQDTVTPDGTALRTAVAAITTDVVRDDVDAQPSFLLGCEWSSGRYLFDEVVAAATEFGLAPRA